MRTIITFIFCAMYFSLSFGQCNVVTDAGVDKHRCSPDSTVQFGGSPVASNGTPPYIYEWWIDPIETSFQSNPYIYGSDILNDTTAENPIIESSSSLIGDSLFLYLRITDDLGCQDTDTVLLTTTHFGVTLGTFEFSIMKGDSVYLNQGSNVSHGFGNTSYLWQPSQVLAI